MGGLIIQLRITAENVNFRGITKGELTDTKCPNISREIMSQCSGTLSRVPVKWLTTKYHYFICLNSSERTYDCYSACLAMQPIYFSIGSTATQVM